MSPSAKEKVVLHAYKSLSRTYGKARKGRKIDPFDQLLMCILSHRSSESAAQKAFDQLREEYVDWNEARVATTEELGEILSKAGVSAGAAYALKTALEAIFNKQYAMDLTFLEGAKPEEARRMLMDLDGIPDQIISAWILLTYDNQPVPADEDIARVVRRLGAVKPDAAVSTVERTLRGCVSRKEAYNFFRVFVHHAHTTCLATLPDCAHCTLRRFCAHGQAVLAEAKQQRAAARRSDKAAATAKATKKTATTKATRKKTTAKSAGKAKKKAVKKKASRSTAAKTASAKKKTKTAAKKATKKSTRSSSKTTKK